MDPDLAIAANLLRQLAELAIDLDCDAKALDAALDEVAEVIGVKSVYRGRSASRSRAGKSGSSGCRHGPIGP